MIRNGAMLVWYLISAVICSLVTGFTAFEPRRHITFVGTVFSVTVSVGGNGLTASGTNIFINRFLSDTLRVSVPPFLPTLRRTETLRFSAGGLRYRLAAFRADSFNIFLHSGILTATFDIVPTAESLNGIS